MAASAAASAVLTGANAVLPGANPGNPTELSGQEKAAKKYEIAALETQNFAERPKQLGTKGKKTQVIVNHYKVNINLKQIHHFNVVITPWPDKRKPLVRAIFNKIVEPKLREQYELESGKKVNPGQMGVFDGARNFYSTLPLESPDGYTFEDVPLPKRPRKPSKITKVEKKNEPKKDEEKRPPRKPRTWTIRVHRVATVSPPELIDYVKGNGKDFPQKVVQALDIVLHHNNVAGGFKISGRSCFQPKSFENLGGSAHLWRGFRQNFAVTQHGLTLNVDLTGAAFHQHGNLREFITACCGRRDSRFRPGEIRQLDRQLKGLNVEASFENRRGEKRRYKIGRLDQHKTARTHTFQHDKLGDISVFDYYRQTYKNKDGTPMVLKYPDYPLAECLSRDRFKGRDPNRKLHVPVELLEIIPGQKKKFQLDGKQQAAMIKKMSQSPSDRRKMTDARMQESKIADAENDLVRQLFKITIEKKMIQQPCRILPDQKINMGSSSFAPRWPGCWNVRGKRFYRGATLSSWAVLQFGKTQPFQFIGAMARTMAQLGMKVTMTQPPVEQCNPFASVEEVSKAYETIMKKAQAHPDSRGRPCQFVLCIKPDDSKMLYGHIKNASDRVYGVPSQCVLEKHIRKSNNDYMQNVALKINTKCGGVNWICAEPLPKFDEPTMIMGVDVNHPGVGNHYSPSICSAVASMDRSASKYEACFMMQEHRQEDAMGIKAMTTHLLRRFYINCKGRKPKRIVIYRDGISYGQFERVMTDEINRIRMACQALEPGYSPALTYVVCQKRHRTRLFPCTGEVDTRSKNVLPGFVVDSGIASPRLYDFYLMSHAGLKGTSRPAHYHVLLDEVGFSADEIQLLTFRLCYTFQRATRSVSICTPVYYAHLVAYRARVLAADENDDDMRSVSSFGSKGNKTTELTADMQQLAHHKGLVAEKSMFFI